MSSLTKVQRDVLDRMRDGAWIGAGFAVNQHVLFQEGQPRRHVAWNTFDSLVEKGAIKLEGHIPFRWILA